MEQVVSSKSIGYRKSLGPGILLAAACIGGSHLMSSTTAGAKFGFSLIGLILLTNIVKYPFLLVGTRFTAVTGLSLLEGFQKRNKFYIPVYLIIGLIKIGECSQFFNFHCFYLYIASFMQIENMTTNLKKIKN